MRSVFLGLVAWATIAQALPQQPSAPAALPAKVQEQTPLYHTSLGAKRVKIRYGPYTAPSVNTKNVQALLLGEGGMMDAKDPNGLKPCEDCMVTWMRAGLEYSDGREANVDTGLWLHHVVLSLKGEGRHDTVCPKMGGERIFSSGNERTVVDLTNKGAIRAGYPFRKIDTYKIAIELENQNPEPKEVYLTMTYEFVPGLKQNSFKNVTASWFDVSNCGPSFVFPGRTAQFSYNMDPWTATFNGDLVFVGGHLHDAGTHVVITQNQKTVCDSVASYGTEKSFVTNIAGKEMGMKHISNMTTCHQFGRMTKGDVWGIKADYDTTKYRAMENGNGRKDMVMGIAIMYTAIDN